MKRMSYMLLIITLLSFGMMFAEDFTDDSGLVWQTDLDDAMAMAKENGKPLLVNFTGSDWCGWCIKLRDEVFSKKEFHKYANDNLNLVFLDFPRGIKQSDELKATNRKILEQYGVRGFPTILLLDAEGSVIAQTGYQQGGAEAYVKHLQGLLTKE